MRGSKWIAELRFSVALALCLVSAGIMASARADESAAPALLIDGLVKRSLHLTVAELRSLPAVRREISFRTDHGDRKASYVGALLWDVIQHAGVDDPAKWGELRHVMAVTGKDAYLVMFSLGEIDPNFGNAPVIIAYEQDGHPIGDGALRLVVPGDIHGARDVRDLIHIELR
ncbi:MAG TPA: molybdopterin-dependent oxidoreductase [Stellaceae bacterium]|nr:molybdopterin-dependent oxidoreductase [Stellaceae bacterium]